MNLPVNKLNLICFLRSRFQVCTLPNASQWLHQSLIIFKGFTVKLDFLLDYHTLRILMVITLIINKVSKINKKVNFELTFIMVRITLR